MANTPPTHQPGDGVELTTTEARGSQRTGHAIWILVISLVLIVVLFGGYLMINAGHIQRLDHPAGRDLNASDAATYQTPPPAPRQNPGQNASAPGP